MRAIPLFAFLSFFGAVAAQAAPAEIYLYYNAGSPSLYEIEISKSEVERAFDDIFGPASQELPAQVQMADFYVSRYPDGAYVYILNAQFNCGQIGCNTIVYRRDADGDLQPTQETLTPVKCKEHADDKLLCIKGGYKPDLPKKPKVKGPVHYPAPRED